VPIKLARHYISAVVIRLSSSLLIATMPPKGSSYMIFSTELRASVKESLQAEGKPCAMGDVAKALGARWRELSADEKKV